MAILPIQITVTPTWQDVTTQVTLLELIDEEVVEIFLSGGQLIEVIIDTLGATTIDNTYDGKGTQIEGSQFKTFPYTQTTKFWVRRIPSNLSKNSQIKIRKQVHNVNINGVKVYENALNIHDADVHTRVINKLMHQHTNIVTTLTAPISGDGTEYQIEIADATDFTDGDYLHINTTSLETTHPILLSSVPALPTAGPAVFTLDRKLDVAHSIDDEVRKSIVNMASQDGTLASPQEYWVGPQPGEVWHLTRFLFSMVHDLAGDAGKFGGIPALTNGVILRVRLNGQYGTFTNWKTNSDMEDDMFDVRYSGRSGGQGDFGTNGRGTITESGAIVRLNGDTNDRVEVYIQDALVNTGLNKYTMKFQGHFEDQ